VKPHFSHAQIESAMDELEKKGYVAELAASSAG
jgi:hypothetical protein